MAKQRKRAKRPVKRRWKTSRILTWIGLASLGVAIVILGFFAFAGGDDAPRRAVRQQPVVSDEPAVAVEVVDNDFIPNNLTVRPGTEITWEFKGDAAHDVTSDGQDFEGSGTMTKGDEFVMTFDDPGTYYYSCTLHHSMQGTLIVAP
jgi:plastocyanin